MSFSDLRIVLGLTVFFNSLGKKIILILQNLSFGCLTLKFLGGLVEFIETQYLGGLFNIFQHFWFAQNTQIYCLSILFYCLEDHV